MSDSWIGPRRNEINDISAEEEKEVDECLKDLDTLKEISPHTEKVK